MTQVFFAVRTALTDLKTGSPTLTQSSGVATISIAQTGDIGQGWVIDYGATNKLEYISEFTSTTSFKVTTATGANPSDEGSAQTINSIKPVWASLSVAEAAYLGASFLNTTDLVTSTLEPFFMLYKNGVTADTTMLSVLGATTSTAFFLTIKSPTGGTESANDQSNEGVWTTSRYHMISSDRVIEARDNNTNFIGIQMEDSDAADSFSAAAQCAFSATGLVFDRCTIRIQSDFIKFGIYVASGDVTVINTIIIGLGATISSSSEGIRGDASTVSEYCAVFGVGLGYTRGGGTVTATNCIGVGNTNDFNGTITITNCATEQGAGEGTSGVALINGTYAFSNIWTDYAGSPNDFNLVNDTSNTNAPQNKGTSISVSVDILGNSRDGTSPDIGPFEFLASGGSTITGSISENFSLADLDSNIANFVSSVSDNLTFNDSVSNVATFVSSIAENFTLSDDSSSSIIFTAIVSENFTLADSVINTATIRGTVSENLTLSDVSASINLFIAEVLENFTLSDRTSFQQASAGLLQITAVSKNITIEFTIEDLTIKTETNQLKITTTTTTG